MEYSATGSIVLYKSSDRVLDVVFSFLDSKTDVLLFLVDNSPNTAFIDRHPELKNDSRIQYIFNGSNLGYGAAHNVAMRQILSKTGCHFVLNPDISFKSDVIDRLTVLINDDPNIGLIMPRVYYENGEEQKLCKLLPTPVSLFGKRFSFFGSIFKKSVNDFLLADADYSQSFSAPYLSGCFMCLNTSVLKKIGLFDERFFMYLEDTDLSRRINAVSRTLYYPEVSIIHDHAQGSYKNLKLFRIHLISAFKYFNKWGWFRDAERERLNQACLQNIKRNNG